MSVSSDTWLWKEQAWSKASGEGDHPTAREGAGMVYEPSGQRYVLFGGVNADTTGASRLLDDTWEYAYRTSDEEGVVRACDCTLLNVTNMGDRGTALVAAFCVLIYCMWRKSRCSGV
jgi:hypothetical protein